MSTWLENTAYMLLNVDATATKKKIQTAYDIARRKEKDTRKQRELSDARDQLTKVEPRLSIDAFVFDVPPVADAENLAKEVTPLSTHEPDWLMFADTQAVINYDLEQLLDVIIELSLSSAQEQLGQVQPIDRYSGTKQFEKEIGL